MARRVEETEVNNIFFCYQIGDTFTAIWTKDKDQYSAAIPDYYKMSFGFETPEGYLFGDKMMRAEQILESINRRIRDKASEQKATGRHAVMKITAKEEKEKKKKRR